MSDTKSAESPPEVSAPTNVRKLNIHFIKSTQFRVIHASGVWYGGDNQGNLHLTFFNERTPIPQKLVLNINDKGVVGDVPAQHVTKEGIVREMEVDVILSLPAAWELFNTLGENLKVIQANIKNATPVSK